MMKSITLFGFACAFALTIPATSLAQGPLPNQVPGYMKLGYVVPRAASLKSATDAQGFSITYGYPFAKSTSLEGYWSYLGGSQNLQTSTMMVVHRFTSKETPLYLGLGIGGAYLRFDDDFFVPEETFSIAGKVMIGLQIDQSFIVEAEYMSAGRVAGLPTEQWSFSLGYRF